MTWWISQSWCSDVKSAKKKSKLRQPSAKRKTIEQNMFIMYTEFFNCCPKGHFSEQDYHENLDHGFASCKIFLLEIFLLEQKQNNENVLANKFSLQIIKKNINTLAPLPHFAIDVIVMKTMFCLATNFNQLSFQGCPAFQEKSQGCIAKLYKKRDERSTLPKL